MKVSILTGVWACALVAADKLIENLSLGVPFISHDFENDNYDYGGSAVLTKSHARLTADQPGQRGWIVARQPLQAENFEIEVSFKIESAGSSLYGDGMAVWLLAPDEKIEEGEVFGLKDYFKGTAILIDTYRNHRPGKAFPYVMVMQNDGHQHYDNDNDGKANELAGYSARGLHNPSSISKMRVRFQGGQLTVSINYKGRWEDAFSLPFNPDGANRIAVSASTGQLSERHDIYGIQVTELHYMAAAKPVKSKHEASEFAADFSASKGSSWFGWLFGWLLKLVLGVGAVAGALKLYRHYTKKKRTYEPFEFS